MSPLRLPMTIAVLLAFAPGCEDRPEAGRKLVPVMAESGRITYRFEDEMTEPDPAEATSSGYTPAPRFVTDDRRANDQLRREIEERRRNQVDQIRQNLANRVEQQAALDALNAQRRQQREQSRLEQQALRDRQSDLFARSRQANEQAARDQAARDERWLEAQSRAMQRRSEQDFQRLMLEQQRQSRP